MHKTKFFLIFILLVLCQKLKAESNDSAFGIYTPLTLKDSTALRKYELAKIYFDENKYTRSLKLLYSINKKSSGSRLLDARINLLLGNILNKFNDSREISISLDSLYIEKAKLKVEDLNPVPYLKKSISLLKSYSVIEGNEDYNHKNEILGSSCIALSYYFMHSGKKDSAKYYLQELVKIDGISEGVLTNKAKGFTNLGRVYAFEKDYNKAEDFFLKSIEINEIIRDNITIALAYNNLANIYVVREDYKEAKKLYSKAIDYIENEKSLKAIERQEMLYDNIAWALYKLKDYTAYEYVTKSYGIRDSLKQGELKKALTNLKTKNDVNMAVQQEQIKTEQQERNTWIIGVTGIVVSLLLLYFANLYKLRQRSLSLKLSQNQLEQQRKLERLKSQSQVKILNATIDGKETERKQIAEILHDNVSALLSSANMHLQASQKQFKDTAVPIELAKTQEIIAEASLKIRDLSHNLMSSVLLKFGLEYAVKDVAKKFSNSTIRINTAIHNVYRYSQDYEIKIFNIIQELINNILKHSQANNAYVIMEEEDEMLNIIVKDDGVGFKNKSEEEKGVGINQIKARINMMNGTFLIESSKGMGTKTTMKIPVVRKKTRVYSA